MTYRLHLFYKQFVDITNPPPPPPTFMTMKGQGKVYIYSSIDKRIEGEALKLKA